MAKASKKKYRPWKSWPLNYDRLRYVQVQVPSADDEAQGDDQAQVGQQVNA